MWISFSCARFSVERGQSEIRDRHDSGVGNVSEVARHPVLAARGPVRKWVRRAQVDAGARRDHDRESAEG